MALTELLSPRCADIGGRVEEHAHLAAENAISVKKIAEQQASI